MATKKAKLRLLHRQASAGSTQAQRLLGEKYLNGKGVPRDIRKAAMLLSRAANRGDRRAKDILREKLRIAARHTAPVHLEFIRIAADEHVGQAQRLLGKKYLYGKGLPRDVRKAVHWLALAASNGDRGARDLIREKFLRVTQYGGSRDLAFVRVFAENGMAQAQCLLGESYLAGSGVNRDYRLAEQQRNSKVVERGVRRGRAAQN